MSREDSWIDQLSLVEVDNAVVAYPRSPKEWTCNHETKFVDDWEDEDDKVHSMRNWWSKVVSSVVSTLETLHGVLTFTRTMRAITQHGIGKLLNRRCKFSSQKLMSHMIL